MASQEGLGQEPETIALQLIDSAQGRLLQIWCFTGRDVITIGRAAERDVVIAVPYVSRLHAELQLRNEQWWLVSRGQHGVLVANQPITEELAYSGMQFRLGSEGPVLRFVGQLDSTAEDSATLCLDSVDKIVLRIDESKLSAEVRAITEGDYFQTLKAKARDLRHQRHASTG